MPDTPYEEAIGRSPAPAARILNRLKTHGQQCVKDVAEALDLTAEAVRQQMAKLHADGLVEDAPSPPRGGRGRPTQVWSLTPAGHGRFRDSHAEVMVQMIDAVRASFGNAGVDKVISAREASIREQYLSEVAGITTLKGRVEKLVEIRRQEGYMAEARREGAGFLMVENHCPICAAATACMNFCRSELSLFREVLGPDAVVERTEHLLAGARRCAYRVTPVSASAASAAASGATGGASSGGAQPTGAAATGAAAAPSSSSSRSPSRSSSAPSSRAAKGRQSAASPASPAASTAPAGRTRHGRKRR